MHTIKETDMLTAKLDLLLKKLDEGNRQQMLVPIHAMSSHSTYESGKIPGQPESPVETTNMVSTGWGCDTLGVCTIKLHLFPMLYVRNCLSKGLF